MKNELFDYCQSTVYQNYSIRFEAFNCLMEFANFIASCLVSSSDSGLNADQGLAKCRKYARDDSEQLSRAEQIVRALKMKQLFQCSQVKKKMT